MPKLAQRKWARSMAEKIQAPLAPFIHAEFSLEQQSQVVKLALHKEYSREEVPLVKLHWGRVLVMDKKIYGKNLVRDELHGTRALSNHWWVTVGEYEDVIIDYKLQDRLEQWDASIPHGSFSKYDVFTHWRYISRGVIWVNLSQSTDALIESFGHGI